MVKMCGHNKNVFWNAKMKRKISHQTNQSPCINSSNLTERQQKFVDLTKTAMNVIMFLYFLNVVLTKTLYISGFENMSLGQKYSFGLSNVALTKPLLSLELLINITWEKKKTSSLQKS